ncbi:MAG: hypothetical protein FWC50_10175 [Planctomycetaceae bacterium]|nr:hypothetical protein [Planctomycetaceae bacterium]
MKSCHAFSAHGKKRDRLIAAAGAAIVKKRDSPADSGEPLDRITGLATERKHFVPLTADKSLLSAQHRYFQPLKEITFSFRYAWCAF